MAAGLLARYRATVLLLAPSAVVGIWTSIVSSYWMPTEGPTRELFGFWGGLVSGWSGFVVFALVLVYVCSAQQDEDKISWEEVAP